MCRVDFGQLDTCRLINLTFLLQVYMLHFKFVTYLSDIRELSLAAITFDSLLSRRYNSLTLYATLNIITMTGYTKTDQSL